MQSRNDPGSCTQILRIGEQRFERLSGGFQQSFGEARSIELPERVQLFGDGKDDVDMLAVKQVGRGSVEPVGSSTAAALRAASMPAGVVLNGGDMAAVTSRDMATGLDGSALNNGRGSDLYISANILSGRP
jgi:hypothetical protein